MFGDVVGSISIFTYLGELFYYAPSPLTAFIAGALMAALALVVDRMLLAQELLSTRVFAGLMCIVLLRSRVLDVMSFLLFLLCFLLFWRVIAAGRSARRDPAQRSRDRPALVKV
jgi:hypothetical protein